MQIRPSYEEEDALEREAQVSSWSTILSTSFAADLWIGVIEKAIEDLVVCAVNRAKNKELSEEELEYEASAEAFLFDPRHRVPLDDYLVRIRCTKCQKDWLDPISKVSGTAVACIYCKHTMSWKYLPYEIEPGQSIKDISLSELVSVWGVQDMNMFREGCKRKIERKTTAKLKLKANQ